MNFITEDISEYSQIPPMLFLPFLENSFKHGKDISGNIWIDIVMKQENKRLYFEISNSKSDTNSVKEIEETENGIGLENVRQRLDLLYKNHYLLEIEDLAHTI